MVDGGNSAVRSGDVRFSRTKNILRPRARAAGVPHALPNVRALVGSLLCVGAALLAWFAATGGTDVPARPIIVAARDIPAGVVVSPEDVEVQSLVVPNGLGERTFSAEAVVVGTVTLGPVSDGDPVLRSVVGAGSGTQTPRQLSLSLPVAAAVGGTLRSGDTVDVFATYEPSGDEPARTVALARKVLISRISGADPNVVSPTGDRLITFALEPLLDVEQFINASATAKIHLVRTTGSETSVAADPAVSAPTVPTSAASATPPQDSQQP